jgi:hypothetical protein
VPVLQDRRMPALEIGASSAILTRRLQSPRHTHTSLCELIPAEFAGGFKLDEEHKGLIMTSISWRNVVNITEFVRNPANG